MEEGRQPRSFLDRPVRSLLDLKIGTVLKAYLLYGAVSPRAQLETVRSRFGEPATTGPNPFDRVTGTEQTCLGYRSSASGSLYLFCFEGGRLVEKKTF